MSSSTNNSQSLSSKEVTLFKKLLKCYELKQYKQGLRYAKQILQNPNHVEHGETLAMKGLILNCLDKHEEARKVVRRGLEANIHSHICWHVFGLVQHSDKKYEDAMKAYKMALKIDNDNLQILRDLSLLQIQMRDITGYMDSRHKLLVLRPSNKVSWIGYANACHIAGDYDMALNIINGFKKNNKPISQCNFENSELILYEIMILREAGRPEAALLKLEENAICIIDRLAYMETRGELLIELDRLDEAEKVYWNLINRNPDNIEYYKKIEQCQKIDSNSETASLEKIKNVYDKALKRRPKSSVPQLLKLFCLKGKDFEKNLSQYLIYNLRKGVPSLFKNLVPLYNTLYKVNIIEKILMDFIYVIEENGYNQGSLDGSDLPECPSTILWVYYYLTQHFDRLKQYSKAHKYIDEALKHTPTLIELYMAKAKIYKHENNFNMAAFWMDQAQELDTADRYINSKCAKYLLRANKIKEAEAMCKKFTREDISASDSLNEMQCMWYELECAKAYNRLGKYAEALKKCHQIEKHFQVFYEDQYDFHGYCIRKMTLCAYVKILRFENVIKEQYFYTEAMKLAESLKDKISEDEKKEIENECLKASTTSRIDNSHAKQKNEKEKKTFADKQKMELENLGASNTYDNEPKDDDEPVEDEEENFKKTKI